MFPGQGADSSKPADAGGASAEADAVMENVDAAAEEGEEEAGESDPVVPGDSVEDSQDVD